MTTTATAPRAAAYRGRLRWWTELPLIAVVYALYSGARLLVRGDVQAAVEHGADILHFEQFMHMDPENWVNQLFTEHAFLGVPADFAYASLHYLVTPTVLVWLWRRRPTHYRVARTWLMISTLIGLIGFTMMPTAPPRLLTDNDGFIDTMAQYGSYGWWGDDASAPRGMGHLTNEYAAMPSLHVGWSLWCGLMLIRFGRHRAVRALGVLYPVVTVLVVMGTANHYLLDAAAGVLVMGVGYLLAKPALRAVDAVHTRLGRGPVPAPPAPAADSPAVGTAGGAAGAEAAGRSAAVPRPIPGPQSGRTGPRPTPTARPDTDTAAGAATRSAADTAAGPADPDIGADPDTDDMDTDTSVPSGEPAARG